MDRSVDKCDEHSAETVKYFCCSHRLLLCGRCLETAHKSCKKVEKISKVTKKQWCCDEFSLFLSNVQQIETQAQTLRNEVQSKFFATAKCCTDAIKAVNELRRNMNILLDKHVADITRQAESISQQDSRMLDTLIEQCKAVQQETKTLKEEFESSKKERMFILVHNNKNKMGFLVKKLSEVEIHKKVRCYTYNYNTFFEELLKDSDRLGKIGQSLEKTPSLQNQRIMVQSGLKTESVEKEQRDNEQTGLYTDLIKNKDTTTYLTLNQVVDSMDYLTVVDKLPEQMEETSDYLRPVNELDKNLQSTDTSIIKEVDDTKSRNDVVGGITKDSGHGDRANTYPFMYQNMIIDPTTNSSKLPEVPRRAAIEKQKIISDNCIKGSEHIIDPKPNSLEPPMVPRRAESDTLKTDTDTGDKRSKSTGTGQAAEAEKDHKPDKFHKARLLTDLSMVSVMDTTHCWATGLAAVGEDVVVADYHNNSVKLIDTSSHLVKSVYKCDSGPWDATVTHGQDNSIAVTLPSQEKVLFLIVCNSELCKDREVNVKGKCHGIACTKDRLVVSYVNPIKIELIDIHGWAVLQVIDKDQGGETIFYYPRYIAVCKDSETLFVSDSLQNAVISLSINGQFLGEHKSSLLKDPGKLWVTEDGGVLVCGKLSNNILKLSGSDRSWLVWLTSTAKLRLPITLCMNVLTQRMFVGMENSNKLKVYKLSY